ncbi:hypothetical protein C9I87_09065 [Photobacterium iliopiscarium]|uniref:tyrosine-type recombinase/integrase n=1 Tax=Photobacterium iliopiscarium TaxID=56192 RepID=UPI000D15508F|nr:tyrosine-type recombinase/integrase [Photobacterium iliopiscarium]PST95410.1 hypothetical protein C9I87_09065 [Photobacterium iliopiscarium]
MKESLKESLKKSLNQERIYFTVIQKGRTYYLRMLSILKGKPLASVTVSLRTKSAITAKANSELLKDKLVTTSGALDTFDNARYVLRNIAKTLNSYVGIPIGGIPQSQEIIHIEPIPIEVADTQSVTFSAMAHSYADERLESMAWTQDTYACRLSDIKTVTSIFSNVGLGDKPLSMITRSDLMMVRSEFLSQHKLSTVNIKLSLIASVFKFAIMNGVISNNPAMKLAVVDRTPKDDKGLSKVELASITDFIKNQKTSHIRNQDYAPFLKWVFLVAAVTGARHGEIQQLRREDIQQTESGTWFISINDNDGKQLKNQYSKRCIPLVDSGYGFDLKVFIREVVDTCSDGSYLFRSNNRTASRSYFTRLLTKYKKQHREFSQVMTFHSLRHSMSWHCLNSKMPESFAKKLLGHSEGITYGRYASAGVDIDLMKEELSRVIK